MLFILLFLLLLFLFLLLFLILLQTLIVNYLFLFIFLFFTFFCCPYFFPLIFLPPPPPPPPLLSIFPLLFPSPPSNRLSYCGTKSPLPPFLPFPPLSSLPPFPSCLPLCLMSARAVTVARQSAVRAKKKGRRNVRITRRISQAVRCWVKFSHKHSVSEVKKNIVFFSLSSLFLFFFLFFGGFVFTVDP